MGVPSYFRWLAEKYGKTVVDALEDLPETVDGVITYSDLTQPNPNGVEFDNLYLDMNGIIHPCSHPENKPQPTSEFEIMQNIFELLDRLFSITRPRKLLYLAIDGVAPRAKMNQQRSRRFRSAKDSREARAAKQKVEEEALSLGRMSQAEFEQARAEANGSWRFDSNSITPGTPFMDSVAKALRWYSYHRLSTNPAWANIQVIISDGNVPGEGEHKIMDYIRHQRNTPNYDPNTTHVLCGLDADLIMLGLATHEPHFYILREFVAFGKQNERERGREAGAPEVFHPYQFLRLGVLREYLAIDLYTPNLPFQWDLERVIDDYVFLCFFVGNDFLPHMPTLEIREGAIELLIEIYKKVLPGLGGYVTEHGEIDLARAEVLMKEVGKLEDAILKRRLERNKQQEKREYQRELQKRGRGGENLDYEHAMRMGNMVDLGAEDRRGGGRGRSDSTSMAGVEQQNNQSAAQKLKDKLQKEGKDESATTDSTSEGAANPDAAASMDVAKPNAEAHEPQITLSAKVLQEDRVRLGEDGWKARYHFEKFKAGDDEKGLDIIKAVAREYMEGLVWVLRYYYQGCCSWTWYYPKHYAPFAGDLIDLPEMGPFDLALGKPFRPFEQLMGVLPADSAECLPEPYRILMTDPNSPILDFYPPDFELDMNGKKQAWHAIALLPFIDQDRLLKAVEPVHRSLSEQERFRNTIGNDIYVVSKTHKNGPIIVEMQEKGLERLHKLRKEITSDIDIQNQFLSEEAVPLPTKKDAGDIAGSLSFSVRVPPCGTDVEAPLVDGGVIPAIKSAGAIYHNPQYPEGFQFPASLLRGVSMPESLLNEDDRKRPALFQAGAPASVILEAVMRSFQGNRGGRGGGRGGGYHGGGRGGRADRNMDRDNGRTGPYDGGHGGRRDNYGGGRGGGYNGGGRGGYNDGGGRGGYHDNRGGGHYNNNNDSYNNRGGGHHGGYNNRGGYGNENSYNGGRGGGRGGAQMPNVRSHHDGGNRGGYQGGGYNNNRGGYQGGGRGGHHQQNDYNQGGYNNHQQGGYGGNQHQQGGYGGHQQQQQYAPPQQQQPFYSHQGYGAAPGYGAPPQQQQPQQQQGGSLSASLAPMLAASAQSLGVPHNYYQQPTQGGFQTSNVNLQQLYQQQQQSRGRPY